MDRFLFLFQLLWPFVLTAQVTIQPAFPQRGQTVTVNWHPSPADTMAAGHPVKLVFTYSNLYELPLSIELQRGDSGWYTSFVLPRYAVFATFYLQVGNRKITPAGGGHYELAVYKGDHERVQSGYLYNGYSLSAQWGRSDHLAADQAAMYRKELAVYPNNYEAQVRLCQYEIAKAAPGEQEKLRKKGEAIIAAKFESDPQSMGNLNLVTMGYLILGENSRLDSIRQVVMTRYPHSPVAKELLTDVIRKEKDTAAMVARLEKELKDEQPGQHDAYDNMHELLFRYYAARGDSARALSHIKGMLSETSPYYPEVLLDITHTLAQTRLAPDTALAYARRSLEAADRYPVGIIRYFPETGHIPSYVPDSVRRKAVSKAKGNALALMSQIYLVKNDRPKALRLADSALSITTDEKTLSYTAVVFESMGLYERAYVARRRLVLDAEAVDTNGVKAMKKGYYSWKAGGEGWEDAYKQVQDERKARLGLVLRQQLLGVPAPSLDSIVDLAGKGVDPASLKGKIVVIDFWATWCMPCMEEMPYLQKVYDLYKNDPRVQFMVINSGARNTLQDARGWFGNKRYSFPVYYHTNPAVGEHFGFNVIPAVYVIDGAGRLQFKTIGFEGAGMEEKLGAEIDLLLKR